jgi:hypothetical protein
MHEPRETTLHTLTDYGAMLLLESTLARETSCLDAAT